MEFQWSLQFTEFPPLSFQEITRFFFSRKIHLFSWTIRPATWKSRLFSQKILAITIYNVSSSNFRGRFERTIFRYCRYLKKSRNNFFTRLQPADSRRSYYDPRPFGTQAGDIQGVLKSHHLYRKIFFVVHPIIAENYVTEYPIFPILSKSARVFWFNISTKNSLRGHYQIFHIRQMIFSLFWFFYFASSLHFYILEIKNKSERLLEHAHI